MSTRSPILSHRVRVVGSNRIVMFTIVWQGWRTHAVRSTPALLRDVRMQASQICVRLSTAQSTQLRATREFFSQVTHFFSRESDGRSTTPLQRPNYGLCGGKVSVIGCMMIGRVRVCTTGPEHER